MAMTRMLLGALTMSVAITGIVWSLRHEGGTLPRVKAMLFTLIGIATPVTLAAVAPALAQDRWPPGAFRAITHQRPFLQLVQTRGRRSHPTAPFRMK